MTIRTVRAGVARDILDLISIVLYVLILIAFKRRKR